MPENDRDSEDRFLAYKSLEWFAWRMLGFRAAAHHREWIEGVNKHRRLLIVAPPEHAKTTWIAVLYPAWRIARDPNVRIVIIASTGPAAEERSKAIQGIIESIPFKRLFPDIRRGRDWAASEWTVSRKRYDDPFPTLVALGVGSDSLIGKRADVLIMDDPMSLEQARSELQRKVLDTWVRQVALTRVTNAPDSKLLCIMTRWHQRDVAGTLIEMGFPTILQSATPEKPLWPERFDSDYLRLRQRDLGTALYNCMYRGDPSGLEGTLVQRHWFEIVTIPPPLRKVVIGWDLATSARETGNRSVGTVLGVGRDDGRLYILEVRSGKWEWPETKRRILDLARDYPEARCVGIESSGFQLAAVQEMRAEFAAWMPIRAIPVDRDKVARALPWIAMAEQGQVRLIRAEWNAAWLDEVCLVPNAEYDDQWDSMTVAYSALKAEPELHIL